MKFHEFTRQRSGPCDLAALAAIAILMLLAALI